MLRPIIAALALTPVLALVACAAAPGGRLPGCAESDRSMAEAVDNADVVFTARVVARLDDRTIAGGTVHVYSVSNVGLPGLKGEDIGYDDLAVISHPGCEDSAYAGGDPLAGALGTDVVLFLVRSDDRDWLTLPAPDGMVDPSGVGS